MSSFPLPMLALSTIPGRSNAAELTDVPPPDSGGGIVAKTLAVGVCGTDREILGGGYGVAPEGQERLIIGHECLAEVLDAGDGAPLRTGDLIVPFVRRPDPVPCDACRVGEWDMCRNGEYLEHGIKALHGFCVERFRIDSDACVRLPPHLRETGVLLEPTSVVAKAWDHIERIGARTTSWQPRRVLVTGAGPIGLLGALLASQRHCDLHVYDREQDGMKPELVRRLGGTYHCGSVEAAYAVAPDVILECTGAAPVIQAVLSRNAPAGIVCLAGLSSGVHRVSLDLAELNRTLVLENDVVFGSVNANRRHYELAVDALAAADESWLRALITRRVAIRDWQRAFERAPGDVKVVIDLTQRSSGNTGDER